MKFHVDEHAGTASCVINMASKRMVKINDNQKTKITTTSLFKELNKSYNKISIFRCFYCDYFFFNFSAQLHIKEMYKAG